MSQPLPRYLLFQNRVAIMTKETRSIDKKGVSNKFFEELDKEHDNAKEFAKRQKELKEKKRQK